MALHDVINHHTASHLATDKGCG